MESIEPDEVHVHITRPTTATADYDALLTDDERTAQRAFVFEPRRLEYLFTRALVRTRLSRYRAIAPAAWRFRTNAYGRPEPDPPCGLSFNLANHASMIVLAVTAGPVVGVDVEPLARGPDIVDIADTVFSPRELAELRRLDADRRADRAVALWTLKEAYIKARGLGLTLPLAAFSIGFGADGAITIALDPEVRDGVDRWVFRSFDVDGHRIALAIADGREPLRVVVRSGPP